ncbi:MAG: hypothetical protein RDU20_00130 [Desulfomonilaceae bacterium]|nr:hypothetical protein [Desulfomonilaceae bacterium]
MADQNRHKTPEELGEAVGKKIEELFGGMFGDEAPQQEESPSGAPRGERGGMEARQGPSSPKPQPRPAVEKKQQPAARAGATPVTAGAARPEDRPGRPVSGQKRGGTFDDIVEQMEILILNLEWEVSPESVNGLIKKFKELETFFPGTGQARTILAMNGRGLRRFAAPDAVPHPSLIKLLQDSLAALKQIHSSRGKRPPSDALIAGLSASYREIMAATPADRRPGPAEPGGVDDDRRVYMALVKNVGTAVHSLEEVSRRLARILGVLRQGGEMSGDEITRRLGTLEHLLSERVGQLSSFHKEMAKVPVGAGRGTHGDEGGRIPGTTSDGLLMLAWEGINLAVPSSTVAAMYPLSESQAHQFQDKPSISIGSRSIPRLPLKKPKGGERAGSRPPAWLVHLLHADKEYFLLVDRSLGFRVTPKGMNLTEQTRIKIGATSFALLNLANFR